VFGSFFTSTTFERLTAISDVSGIDFSNTLTLSTLAEVSYQNTDVLAALSTLDFSAVDAITGLSGGIEINDGALVVALNGLQSQIASTDFSIDVVQLPPPAVEVPSGTDNGGAADPTGSVLLGINEMRKNIGLTEYKSIQEMRDEFDNIGNVSMFASGGVVHSPTLAMIGEGGQSEAVVPYNPFKEDMVALKEEVRLLRAEQQTSNSLQQKAIELTVEVAEQAAGARDDLHTAISDGNSQSKASRVTTESTI